MLAALRAGPAGLRDGRTAAADLARRRARRRWWRPWRRRRSPGRTRSWPADLAAAYPGDPGVLVALLLNRVRLAPGEAIWMPAGNLHAYLRGTGVEIMAASDNVLRGGLTPKRVDVDELLRVLRFEVLDDPVVPPLDGRPGRGHLAGAGGRLRAAPGAVDAALPRGDGRRCPGPGWCSAAAGEVTVDDGAGAVTLGPGRAAVGSAAAGPLRLGGAGEAYVASCGRAEPAEPRHESDFSGIA